MDRDIEDILLKYIREECLPHTGEIEFSDTKNLFESGTIDSAGLISFICFIEKEFNFAVPDEDLLPENFVSVSSIADYIRRRQQILKDAFPKEQVNGYS